MCAGREKACGRVWETHKLPVLSYSSGSLLWLVCPGGQVCIKPFSVMKITFDCILIWRNWSFFLCFLIGVACGLTVVVARGKAIGFGVLTWGRSVWRWNHWPSPTLASENRKMYAFVQTRHHFSYSLYANTEWNLNILDLIILIKWQMKQ